MNIEATESRLNHINTRSGGHSAVYALSNDGSGNAFFSAGGDGEIIYWPEMHKDEGVIFAKEEGPLMCIHYDNWTDELISGTLNGYLSWINIGLKKITKRQKLVRGGIFTIKSDANFQYFAGDDGSVNQIDKVSKKLINSLQISATRCRALALDDSYIIAGTTEGKLFKIATEEYRIEHIGAPGHSGSIFDVLVTNNGYISAGKDGRLIAWDNLLQKTKDIQAHSTTINTIIRIGQSDLVATGCRDGSIRIWDSYNLSLLKTIDLFLHNGHFRSVNKLIWNENQQTLISGSDDRQIKLWQITGI
ncbi:MAG: hypothetical protein J5I59_02395 [Saprospiraceae bacterium]|nr:hypothetical protein [Saprospiraceae bacterium]